MPWYRGPTLMQCLETTPLDEARARAVLQSQEYTDAVRQQQAFYQGQGIHSVPAVIINERHLIQGGQPVEVFEQALRQIAAQQA